MPPERSGRLAGYYLAGRRLGLLRCTASLTATTLSASATLVAADLVASRGVVGAWFNVAGGAGLIVLGLFLAPRIRSRGSLTFASFIGDLFGDPWLRRLASVICVAAALSWLSLLVRATRLLVAAALPGAAGTWLSAALILVVLAYTALGGQRAVAGSDVVQLAVVLAGFLALLAYAWPGLPAAWAGLPASHRSFPLAPGFGAATLSAWALLYGLPHMVGPDIYSRLLSAADGTVARGACILSGLAKILFGIALAVIVLAAGGSASSGAGGGGEGALLGIVTGVLPSPLDILVLLALLMAFLSSLDTVLLTASSILGHDLIAPTLAASSGRVSGDPVSEIRLARACAVALMVAAFVLDAGADLPVVAWFGFGFALFAGSVGPAVLISLLVPSAQPPRAVVRLAIGAGLAGVIAVQLLHLSTGSGTTGDLVIPGAAASTACMLAGLAATRLRQPRAARSSSNPVR